MKRVICTALVLLFAQSAWARQGLDPVGIDDPVRAPGSPSADLALLQAFHDASVEFGVPASILESVSYIETRWQQPDLPDAGDEPEHPPVYGVMGLRDDDWFGHSLIQGAQLIGRKPEEVTLDPVQNVRAAAALLKSYGPRPEDAQDPLAWLEAVRRYSGIPQDRESTLYLHDVFARIGEKLPIVLPEFTSEGPFFDAPRDTLASAGELPIEWDPSANFDPGLIVPQYIVIHDTEGNYAGAVSWLKSPKTKVSAHFIIRSSDGHIKQLVSENDKAWHARCWNPYAIGIEHEGFISQPKYFTEAMYQSSARLVRALADRFSIPVDDMHIFGHNFWMQKRFKQSSLASLNCNTHVDPGYHWDWSHYFTLIGGAADEDPLIH